ncbi:hypothetical protein C8R41DRAFT_306349 [Lentinula lateritia]|uniref:Uncharacterized protein n=1 Tax=Lentinula lateritia TaxID=40482 RepID=A0ABQ8VHR1_9AGAR|nr:hypothetical protein C8R41DRAFT_306349 [Lentinula lateritia]
MDTSDEEIYKPCPRKDPAKTVSGTITFLVLFYHLGVPQWIKPEDLPKCPTEKTLSEGYRFNARRFRLEPGYIKPRILFYGFGVDIQDFLDYHQRHQLPRPPPLDNQASLWHFIMDQVIDDLNDCCSFKLERVLPLSPKYDYAIALYNSHHISITELEDDEEEDVIRIIKERFGDVVAAQKPQWFFLLEDSIH